MKVGDTVVFVKNFKKFHWDIKEGDEFEIVSSDGMRGFDLESEEGVKIGETRFMMDYFKLKEE